MSLPDEREEALPEGPKSVHKARAMGFRVYLLVLCVYFGSEAILRRTAYTTAVEVSGSDLKRLLEKVPTLIRDPIERHLETQGVEAALETAESPEDRCNLLFKLAQLVGGRRQRRALREITKTCPYAPRTAQAWGILLRDTGTDEAVDTYLDFLARCEFSTQEEQDQVWATGWTIAATCGTDARLKYLTALAETGIVGPGLVAAYDELRRLATRRGDDDLYEHARDLYDQCEQLQIEELGGVPGRQENRP